MEITFRIRNYIFQTISGFILVVAASIMPVYGQAQDDVWLDLLFDIGDIVSDEIFKNQPQTVPGDKRLEKPDDLPKNWQYEFFLEPVFKSKILVVEAGREHNETVLMVHGLGQEGFRTWLKTAVALEKRYHVLMLDLPGFGYSTLPAGRFSPENYAKVLKWLVDKKAKSKVHLVGHSMGGAIALKFGAEYPELVQNAVLADVAGILHRTAFIKHITQRFILGDFIPFSVKGKTLESVLLNDALTKFITLAPDPAKILEKSDLLWNLATMNRPNANAAFALIETDFTGELAKFIHPTTLIWGANDPVTPVRTARLLEHHLPNAQLKFIAEAEHVPMLTHPVEFNQLLVDALGSAAPRAKSKSSWQWPTWKNLECRDMKAQTYTGRYNKVSIHNCEQIELRDISADELIIENSLVYIDNTEISDSNTACIMNNSIIVATNLVCNGETGLIADNSRLDFAGTIVSGTVSAADIKNESYLVLSVSRIQGPDYSGTAHGTYKLSNTQLENSFIKQPPAATEKDYKSSI
jgi:pimeloyl-ACP methyl ester carboxylesterase